MSITHWYLLSSTVHTGAVLATKAALLREKEKPRYIKTVYAYVIGISTATTEALQKYLTSGKLPCGKAFRG